MTNTSRTHALDLPEIRSRIATCLGPKDLASCARVNRSWNDSFTPLLYRSVVLLRYGGPPTEAVERNKHHIRSLTIQIYADEEPVLAFASAKVQFIANSALTTLNLQENSIRVNEAKAMAKVLETNSTLTTLKLQNNPIGDDGAKVLAEALKTNKTLST